MDLQAKPEAVPTWVWWVCFMAICAAAVLFGGCSVDTEGTTPDGAVEIPGPGYVKREAPPASETKTTDAGLYDLPAADSAASEPKTQVKPADSGSATDARPDSGPVAGDGPPRVTANPCGWPSDMKNYVPCCPPGDDCKVTINPALDYCDCASAPPLKGYTHCYVAATHYPTPEPKPYPRPSACVQP